MPAAHYMEHNGITIIRKSDLSKPKDTPSKVALVLAGGAVSGGAYKAGGIKALNDYFLYRDTGRGKKKKFSINDFDIFVGLSAGSLLASSLAAGISPEEIFKTLSGTSKEYKPLKPWQFMSPNYKEPIERVFIFNKKLFEVLQSWLEGEINPETSKRYTLRDTIIKMVTLLPGLISSGLWDIRAIEKYVLKHTEKQGLPNNFVEGYNKYGKELYITAVDLNTGDQVIFGHDEKYRDVPISKAIMASCGLPLWYRTVRIKNPLYGMPYERKYIELGDGGIVRTANAKIAIQKGADLVVCYNPFRAIRYTKIERSLYEQGPYALINQIFRIILGSRLDISKEKYFNDSEIKTDLIYIEPSEDDFSFFLMNPLNFWSKDRAAEHGFSVVRNAIDSNYDVLHDIFSYHGIEITRKYVDLNAERLRKSSHEDKKIEEVMTRSMAKPA